MKKIFIILIMFSFFSKVLAGNNGTAYDYEFNSIDGDLIKLSQYKGKVILVVNVASRCGYTPQYENLQNLFINYKDTDLTILAMTSNSFNQEYASNEDIKKICLVNYDVGFVTSSPINVKGVESHEIFSWLKNDFGKSPKWNFYKYLFTEKDH